MSTESMFDPNQFLSSNTTEAGKRRPPIPEGDYHGTLGEGKFRTQQGVKDPSKSFIFFDIPVDIDLTTNPKVRDLVGQDMVRLTYSTFADFNSSGLDWSPGKNRGITAIRESVGQNVAGKGWNPLMLTGHRVTVKIAHREYPEGSGERQDNIRAIAKP
jgi:hypothetical protein